MPNNKTISKTFNVITVEGSTDASYIALVGNGSNNSSYVASVKIYNGETKELVNVSISPDTVSLSSRGLALVVIHKTTFSVAEANYYDTYYSSQRATDMVNHMLNYNYDNYFFAVVSNQFVGQWPAALVNAFKACGSMGIDNTSGGFYPFAFLGYKGLAEGYALQMQCGDDSSDAGAEIAAYIANGKFTTNRQGVDGTNGTNPPQYTEEFYAWSNDTSTPRVIDPPTIEGSWSTSVPQRGSYAYLWKMIVRHTLISGSNPPAYQNHAAEYYRMSGENGTSIATKGSVVAYVRYKVEMESDLPTAGVQNGSVAWVETDNRLFVFNYLTQQWTVQITLRQGDLVIFYEDNEVYQFDGFDTMDDYATALDGYAYTDLFNGHLMQWSDEAANWLDLGQFKGEAGVTYYTHIAWANSVTFRVTPLEPAQGCLNKRNVVANSVIGGTTTPPTSSSASKPYMGIRIDTIAGADSTDYDTYTWEKVQGAQGERGKTGKFYYYGGVFDPNNSTTPFVVNDANTPYFMYTSGNETHFWVYIKEVSEGNYTMSQMGTPSSSNADWKIMTDDFKYIISEAVFASFAHLGGFIMSDPWMISQTPTSDSPSQNISDFHGDPLNDNFRPMFAVNGQTGAAYIQNATISGNLKTGSFGFLKTSNIGIRTQVYAAGQRGFVLREDGSVTFNLPYYDDEGEITNGYAIEGYGGANFVGNGKNIVLASQQVSGKPKTFVIINGAAKFVLDSIPRSASQATAVGEIYVDTNGYVRVKTS